MLDLAITGSLGDLALDVTLSLGHEPLALVGPNGAGKSSLLLFLLGVHTPTRGRVVVGGEVVLDTDRGIDRPPEDRGLGYLPQAYGLFPHLSAAENVTFALACRHPEATRAERRQRALALLETLEATHLADRAPRELSGGEAQRVALARALASEPRALLHDEPLAALDAGSRQKVRAFLASRLAELRLPALVVTHDLADAVALGSRIAVLERGRVAQLGTLAELTASPRTTFVAELTGSLPPR